MPPRQPIMPPRQPIMPLRQPIMLPRQPIMPPRQSENMKKKENGKVLNVRKLFIIVFALRKCYKHIFFAHGFLKNEHVGSNGIINIYI